VVDGVNNLIIKWELSAAKPSKWIRVRNTTTHQN